MLQSFYRHEMTTSRKFVNYVSVLVSRSPHISHSYFCVVLNLYYFQILLSFLIKAVADVLNPL